MNIHELFQSSKDAPEAEYNDAPMLEHTDIDSGTVVTGTIKYSKAGATGRGAPSFTNIVRVTDGDFAGREFWDSVYLTPGQSDGDKSANKRAFAKLAAVLSDDFFASNPSPEAIAKALKDRKVKVTIKWGKDKDNGGKWSNHTWAPAEGAVAGPAGFSTPAM